MAGADCAEALREGDSDGSILLVGREPDAPYERPPASKELPARRRHARGRVGARGRLVGRAAIELLTRTSVMKMDTEARTATLSTKEEIGYGAALLATGANVKRLRVPTARSSRASTTCARSATPTRSAGRRRRRARRADRRLLHRLRGGGVADDARQAVHARDDRGRAALTGFGPTAGAFFEGVLREHGVECLCADTLASFAGEQGGRVQEVVTESGRAHPGRHGRDGHRRRCPT